MPTDATAEHDILAPRISAARTCFVRSKLSLDQLDSRTLEQLADSFRGQASAAQLFDARRGAVGG